MLSKKIQSSFKKLQFNAFYVAIMLCVPILTAQTINAQQEAMYSQYMFNMLHVNPAYAGDRAVDNVNLMYRKQWVNIDGAPVTASLSWDRRQEKSNIGYGLQIINDKLGIENSLMIKGFYSYRLPFESSALAFGVSGGVLNYQAKFAEVITHTGGDPSFMENVNKFMPSVGVGALFSSDIFYVGISVPDLLETKFNRNNDVVELSPNIHYFLSTGGIFRVTEGFKLKPSVMLKAVAGAPLEFDYNLNAWFNDVIGVGVSYRPDNAFVGMFELQVSNGFRLGYAYDYSISNLNKYSKGTHEIMLRYEFSKSKYKRVYSPRYY